ncbi:hypothetical protein IQ07DRAFT_482775, partial [Pyrenochaeta sp. DS3sAY3a]
LDTPVSNLHTISQYYRSHTPLSDGEKYLHIRFYEREHNEIEAQRWRGLLSKSKAKNLNQIKRNKWLLDCFDKLEPFRALWAGFQLGSFPPILSWRCSQEMENYLHQIHSILSQITGDTSVLYDEVTLDMLQGLAPRWSSRDRAHIESLFTNHHVFPQVREPVIRQKLLASALAVDGMILTLKTFFKHIKVLEPIMLRLRELFPRGDLFPLRKNFEPLMRRHPSIRDILLQNYNKVSGSQPTMSLIQSSEHKELYVELSNPALCSYWQLCLFVLRHNRQDWRSRKEDNVNKQTGRQSLLIRLGHFASRLGFESELIRELSKQDADLSAVRDNMLLERPSALFSVHAEKFEEEALLRKSGHIIFEPRQSCQTPSMTTEYEGAELQAFPATGLYLPDIWAALSQQGGHALSQYGKLVMILTAFFGPF